MSTPKYIRFKGAVYKKAANIELLEREFLSLPLVQNYIDQVAGAERPYSLPEVHEDLFELGGFEHQEPSAATRISNELHRERPDLAYAEIREWIHSYASNLILSHAVESVSSALEGRRTGHKLAGSDPGSSPLSAHLKLTRAPDFGGYTVELEDLEDEKSVNFTDDLKLPGRLRHATGRSGHEALAKLAAAWSRAGFLD